MTHEEFIEEATGVKNLQVGFIKNEDYKIVHENTIIVCHDVFIKCTYNGAQGILLVKRLNHPAKDIYWPVGGRMLRGVLAEDSLRQKVQDECSLTLTDITYLGVGRTLFKEEPFGHGKGTDTLNLVYLAEGIGEVMLNDLHTDPLLVRKDSYPKIRATLVPYIQKYLDTIEEKNLW